MDMSVISTKPRGGKGVQGKGHGWVLLTEGCWVDNEQYHMKKRGG